MYMKIARLPRGPTLSFKIHNFSLARDVVSALKKQLVVEQAFKHSPLIVLNSFSGEGMQLKMMASMFQNMFPTINLTNVDLNTVRRCVLMNYNPSTKLIDFRHYNIKVAPVGISKGVKKVVQGKVPNLAKCEDISEFFSKTGVLSESEAEDDPSNYITVPQKLQTRGNMESGKSAIRLNELGPRLTLQLIKIEDGLLDGEVLYHDLIHKTEEEKLEIQKKREMKKKLKEKRKKIQELNKKAKEQVKQEMKEKSLKGMEKNKLLEGNDGQVEEDDDDKEYYRQETGEEPDNDLFTSRSTGVKRPKTFHSFKNKKPKLDDNRSNDTDRKRKFNKHANKFGPGKKGKKKEKVFGNRDQRTIGGVNSKFVKRKK